MLKISVSLLVFAAAAIAVYYYRSIKSAISGEAEKYSANIRALVLKSVAGIKTWEIVRLEIAAGIAALALFFMTSEILIIIIAAPLMLYLPGFYANAKRQEYIKKYYAGLPGFLESVTSNLKAGLSISKAFLEAASRDSGPVGTEISMVMKKTELGISLQDALLELAARIPVKENEIIISAINTALETGGNITEVLENILDTIRKRDELGREVKALTSQGVLSGFIVGLLPVFLIIAVSFIDPGFMEPMFATTAGKVMLGTAFLMEITGAYAISRIINVK